MNKTYPKLKTLTLKGIFLLGVLFFSSCQEDEAFEQENMTAFSDLITFVTKAQDRWNTPTETRSGDNAVTTPSSKTVEVGETPDGEKLLIRMTVSEGIEGELPKDTFSVEKATRASKPLPGNDELDFGIYANLMNGNGNNSPTYDTDAATPYIFGTRVDVSENYSYSPVRYWPGAGYWLKFFAYRPYKDMVQEGLRVTESNNQPTLIYTVPEAVEKQTDLLAATDMKKGDLKETVNLNFKHLLSAVEFKVGTMPGATINGIGLTGMKKNGMFSDWTTAGITNGMMVVGTDIADYIQDFTKGNTVIGLDAVANKGNKLGKTFFMLPQSFMDESAKLKINLDFSKTIGEGTSQTTETHNYELERPIKDFIGSWDANNTYTYTISTPEEVDVTVEDDLNENKNVKSNLRIKNTGVATVYIRATILGYWVVFEEDRKTYEIIDSWEPEEDGDFVWGANQRNPDETVHWRKEDLADQGDKGYYYYMTPIKRNEVIPIPLFESYTLTAQAPVVGAELVLSIAAQAVLVDDVKAVWPSEITRHLN